MSLMQEAITVAKKSNAAADRQHNARITDQAMKVQALLHAQFGLYEAVWQSYGEDVDYIKRHGAFTQQRTWRYRFLVDDVLIGVVPDRHYAQTAEKWTIDVVYINGACGHAQVRPLSAIGLRNWTHDHPADRRAAFIKSVGKASLSQFECGQCLTRRCGECGHTL